MRRPQVTGAGINHCPGLVAVKQRERQRHGENLVGTQAGVITMAVSSSSLLRAVNHIVQIVAGLKPKPTAKAFGYPFGLGRVLGGSGGVAQPGGKIGHYLQSVVPQGIHFNRFANTGRDHPVAHFGIHPGQLYAHSKPSLGSVLM